MSEKRADIPRIKYVGKALEERFEHDYNHVIKKVADQQFTIPAEMCWVAMSYLQVALRVPAMRGDPNRAVAEMFARQLAARLARTDTLRQIIEEGFKTPNKIILA